MKNLSEGAFITKGGLNSMLSKSGYNFFFNSNMFFKKKLSTSELINYTTIISRLVSLVPIKKAVSKKKKLNYFNYLVNLSFRCGLKVKLNHVVKSAFKDFFELFLFCNNSAFIKEYHYFTVLKSYASS